MESEPSRTEIGERRPAGENPHSAEIDFRQVIDSIPGFICVLGPTGEVERLNRQILEYFGKTSEELKDWALTDAVHPDDLPRVIEALTCAIQTGTPYDIEHRCRRADGVYRWFQVRALPVRDTEGLITGWYVLLIDIDDRKHAEDAIRNSERNLSLIINTIPALAWSARTDGSAEFFNQHYLDYVGLAADQAEYWDFTTAVHPDDLAGLTATFQAFMTSGTPGEAEARLRRFDGQYRWFLFRANPLRDHGGAIVRWYGTNTDIDERKRAEDALGKTRSELAHVARVTSLGALTASIAHEVNQPLSGIITNAGTCLRMLAADPPNIDGARETARRTIRDGNRAADVITRLRALFSKTATTIEPVDLNEAAREVIALSWGDLQRSRIVVRTELAEKLPLAGGNRVQLQQVIMNLLRNASDAMSGVDDRPRRMVIRTERDETDHVRLAVQDNGVGLGTDGAERLFEAFYTTKSDGMGIGLSVSRSIVESHQGRLWAVSNDGPGATFAFSIPEYSGDEAPAHDTGAAHVTVVGTTQNAARIS